MTAPPRLRADAAYVAALEDQLQEARETLDAIRNGDVDAIVVGGPAGQQVYTLHNADRPYRVLIEQMQEGAVTLAGDGAVLYCNQRFAALLGRPRDKIVGGPIDGFFHPADVDRFRRLLARPDGGAAFGQFTLVAANGADVPVNVSLIDLQADDTRQRLVCAVVTDLTHIRRRSDELAAANQRLASEIEERRHAEDRLQLALDAADMGTWDLDLDTGGLRRSPRHDQIFGHPQPLAAWSLADTVAHFVPEDRAAVADAFARAAACGAIEVERRICRHHDQAIRWINLKGRVHFTDGRAVRIAGVVTDATDRRRLDEQLRHAQKMEAVGQLTGGVAHDFNNLLMIIGGSLDMLSRSLPSTARTARLIEAARQGVARGAKLNSQLLAFARRQDLQAEAVAVDSLIAGFQDLLARAVGETVVVRITADPEPWGCLTDAHQLEAAILNLAINARDAMPRGGTLTLATAKRTLDDREAGVWGVAAGDYVVVSVADTGVGMPPAVLARVFEPFFTTKGIGKGTGLGLSQVYGFAQQSGGFVTIDSEPGRGTTVAIHLPRTELPAPGTETAELAADIVAGRGIVLVVEDDPEVRATTSGLLQDLGYTVIEAETGRVALDLVARGAAPDLVFTDVIMPDGMSGLDLASELRARRPDLPVLLTSGYTAQRLLPEPTADGLRVLHKPYSRLDLSRAIREILRS